MIQFETCINVTRLLALVLNNNKIKLHEKITIVKLKTDLALPIRHCMFSRNNIFIFFFASLVLTACTTLNNKNLDGISVVYTKPENCITYTSKDFTSSIYLSPKNSYYEDPINTKEDIIPFVKKRNAELITAIKLHANEIEADTVALESQDPVSEKDVVLGPNSNPNIKKEKTVSAEYYICKKQLSVLSENLLEKLCDSNNAHACIELAERSRLQDKFYLMRNYIQKACHLNDKNSCKWVADYEAKKKQLKADCINHNGNSCLAAARASDIEGDVTLMMTFLKQGCGYKHSECCFYLNYTNEVREQENIQRKNRELANQQYMIKLQQEGNEISKQINNTLSFMTTLQQQQINQNRQYSPNKMSCTTTKDYFGTVHTNCN